MPNGVRACWRRCWGGVVVTGGTTEPVPNTPELVGIYRFIRDNPEEWVQASFGRRNPCGTAYCVAGHAVVRAGHTVRWETRYFDPSEALAWTVDNENESYIGDIAQAVLGLNLRDASDLFVAGNTLDDIRRIIERITGVDPDAVPVGYPGGVS
jgi:hypothetical protein